MKIPMIALSILSAVAAEAKPTRTYFLKVTGNQEIGSRLVEDLLKRDCFTMADLQLASRQGVGDCHAFRKFKSMSQIKGSTKGIGGTFLYKVTIDSPKKFNLQIFQREGAGLRRILNAGDFSPKEDFSAELTRTTVGLTFK